MRTRRRSIRDFVRCPTLAGWPIWLQAWPSDYRIWGRVSGDSPDIARAIP
jgi:hypothetical protein